MKLPKLQIVVWEDAQTHGSWTDPKEYDTALIVTVGFLVKETDSTLTLAGSHGGEECNNAISIPKGWDLLRVTIPWPHRVIKYIKQWMQRRKFDKTK